MSDLVERLRNSAIVMQDQRICAEAADEIERLREGRDTMGNLWAKANERALKAEAEIERLQQEKEQAERAVEYLTEMSGKQGLELAKANQEIERLRATIEELNGLDVTQQICVDAIIKERDDLRNQLVSAHKAIEGLFVGGFIDAGTRSQDQWACELEERLKQLRSALTDENNK